MHFCSLPECNSVLQRAVWTVCGGQSQAVHTGSFVSSDGARQHPCPAVQPERPVPLHGAPGRATRSPQEGDHGLWRGETLIQSTLNCSNTRKHVTANITATFTHFYEQLRSLRGKESTNSNLHCMSDWLLYFHNSNDRDISWLMCQHRTDSYSVFDKESYLCVVFSISPIS